MPRAAPTASGGAKVPEPSSSTDAPVDPRTARGDSDAAEAWTRCPRCRRRIRVPLQEAEHTCRHCGARMVLGDTVGQG